MAAMNQLNQTDDDTDIEELYHHVRVAFGEEPEDPPDTSRDNIVEEAYIGSDADSEDCCINVNQEIVPGGSTEDFKKLFMWPKQQAEKMFKLFCSPEEQAHIGEVLKWNLVHNECFAGTGSAGIALHMVHHAFCSEWMKRYPSILSTNFNVATNGLIFIYFNRVEGREGGQPVNPPNFNLVRGGERKHRLGKHALTPHHF